MNIVRNSFIVVLVCFFSHFSNAETTDSKSKENKKITEISQDKDPDPKSTSSQEADKKKSKENKKITEISQDKDPDPKSTSSQEADKKNSKVKVEDNTNKKKDIPEIKKQKQKKGYSYDPDLLPLSFIISPCMNIIWSKKGEASDLDQGFFGSINVMRFMLMYDFQIVKSNFFVSAGIGWSNHELEFKNGLALYKLPGEKVKFVDGEKIVGNALKIANPNETDFKVNNSRFKSSYLDFALEFQFRLNRKYYKEGFFTCVGVVIGWCFTHPHSMVYYSQDKDSGSGKESKRIYLEEELGKKGLKVAPTFRIGYGPFGVFLEWSLLNTFKADSFATETSLKSCSVGITFDFF